MSVTHILIPNLIIISTLSYINLFLVVDIFHYRTFAENLGPILIALSIIYCF